MERPYSGGATAAVCKVGFEGPTKHVAVVSVVWNQSQVRLQMEASLRARRSARTVGSEAVSPTLAAANEREVDEANSAVATAPSELGKSQAASSTGQRIQRAASPGSAYDQQVAQKDEAQWPGPKAYSARTAEAAWKAHDGWSKQPGMDSGLQRMVSNPRRASSRSADSAGFAQSLSAEYPVVGRSTVGAGAAHLSAVVRAVRLSRSHSRGQRWSVRIDWPSGAFAFERLVDGAGNIRGVHRSRPSRAERRARANASGDEGRNHSAALAQSARAATPDGSLGARLQPSSPSRSLGAADSGGSLPSSSPGPQERNVEISPEMDRETGQEQRADQVARSKALRGGSVRRLPNRPQAGQEEMDDLFRPLGGWRTLGTRCRWNAPGQVCSSPMTSSTPASQMDGEGSEHKNLSRERLRDQRFQMPDARCPISR